MKASLALSAPRSLARRSTSRAPPTRLPPTKAIKASTTVQRAASSRLRRMSQKLNSSMVSACSAATEDKAGTGPVQHVTHSDGQQQVDHRHHDVSLEGP